MPHTHSHEAHPPEPEGPEPISVTHFTERTGVFIEYPPLIVGQSAKFLVHLTLVSTGAPVTSGPVTLECTGADGATLRVVTDQPKRDGLFTPELTFAAAGTYRAKVVVRSPLVTDDIALPDMIVSTDLTTSPPASKSGADRIPFLLEQQWKIGLLSEPAAPSEVVQRIPVAATVTHAPNRVAFIRTPEGGRLLRAKDQAWPLIGDRVTAGQTLAILELPRRDAIEVDANLATTNALALDLRTRRVEAVAKLRESEGVVAEKRIRLTGADAVAARMRSLREMDLATQDELDRAQSELAVTKSQLASATASLESSKEALGKLDELIDSLPVAKGKEGSALSQYELKSPIAGTLVEAWQHEGEVTEANAPVWRVVDDSRVWVEARVSEFESSRVGTAPRIQLTQTAASGESQRREGKLVLVGRDVDPTSRTFGCYFDYENTDGQLRVGMNVDVRLEVGRLMAPVTIQESAIIYDQGRPTAYVIVTGEAFERRDLQLGLKSDGRVQVISGIAPQERVVIRGAQDVRVASFSPAAFGHGHAH